MIIRFCNSHKALETGQRRGAFQLITLITLVRDLSITHELSAQMAHEFRQSPSVPRVSLHCERVSLQLKHR